MKRPAFQFYPADWRKDAALQSCSVAAQGLWINAMCIAHECDPYGHLTVNGKPMTAAQIGRLVGLSPKEADRLIAELDDAGVLARTEEGAIYSRRMVRDEEVRNKRAAGGKEGAEHGSKGASHGSKGGRPKSEKGGIENPPSDERRGVTEPPLKPPPSSSSSSSTSVLFPEANASSSAAEPPPCPHQRLLELFAEIVPELPQPRRELWEGGKGAEAMRQRWKWLLTAKRSTTQQRYATTTDEGLAWFRRFFDQVAASDFLTGRNGVWKNCDLTWLMGKENFTKVVQGNYANDRDQP